MTMKRTSALIPFFFICCPVFLFGQKVFKSKADQLKAVYNFQEASRYYMGLYEAGDRRALVNAAMSLYESHRFEDALPYFSKADSLSLLKDGEEIFAYFECLKWMKRYDEADRLIRNSSADKVTEVELALNENKMPLYRKLLDFKEAEVKGMDFNTEYSEISPTLYNGWLYFISTAPERASTEYALINNQPYYSLYTVPLESDLKGYVSPEGSFGRAEKTVRYMDVEGLSLPDGMNQKFHDGPIYAAPSGKIVFFNTNWSLEKRPAEKGLEINLLMYYITKTGDAWSQPKPLPFNTFTYSNQHPFFDEATSTLYFSSNMPGGYGRFDLWKSTLTGDTWSKPVNLGAHVNSPRDEVFPCVAPDGTLIFSSNGWPGIGGLDLFMITDAKKSPINMTAAINSERDDFGICFRNSGLAYLTSNRVGGKGDDDIYQAKVDLNKLKNYMDPPDSLISPAVRDSVAKIAEAEQMLQENRVALYRKLQEFKAADVRELEFNTPNSEISPTLYNNWLYYVTDAPQRDNALASSETYYTLRTVPAESDLKGSILPAGALGQPEETISYQGQESLSLPDIMGRKQHEGPLYVAPSGEIAFFNTNWSMTKRPADLGKQASQLMYYITKTGNIWSQPKALPFNSFRYSSQHPFFDEASSTLYFSSNRPGGYGKFDLWKSTLTGETWSEPVNLGTQVNSPRDEVFPVIAPDGTFMFSSNGWPGLGGLDLFMVTDPQRPPVNMTAALNSDRDDFGLCFRNPGLVYLASNRAGGKGEEDIYQVRFSLDELKEYMRPPDHVIAGTVRNQSNGEPLDGVKITLSGAVARALTSTKGLVDDKIPVSTVSALASELIVRYEKEGFQTLESKFTAWKAGKNILDISAVLIPVKADDAKEKAIERFIVYFNFDKYSIRKDAAEVLASLTAAMMEDDGRSEVFLTGHTDSRGSSAYNERLALQRVKQVRKWLVKQGISADRIRTESMGERQFAVWCKEPLGHEFNPDTCLSPAEHQRNRRVEIELWLERRTK